MLLTALDLLARSARTLLGWRPPAGRLSWLQPLLLTIAVSARNCVDLAFTFFADIVARDLEPIRKLVKAAPIWIAFRGARRRRAAVGGAAISRLPAAQPERHAAWVLGRPRLIANTGWTMLHFGYSWLSLADVFLAGLLFSLGAVENPEHMGADHLPCDLQRCRAYLSC